MPPCTNLLSLGLVLEVQATFGSDHKRLCGMISTVVSQLEAMQAGSIAAFCFGQLDM